MEANISKYFQTLNESFFCQKKSHKQSLKAMDQTLQYSGATNEIGSVH